MERRSQVLLIFAPALILLMVLLAGCTGTPVTQPVQPPDNRDLIPSTTPVSPGTGPIVTSDNSVAEANNHFAADLYRELAKENPTSDRNIFFSPFSISSALALTYEGARGTTADEIRSVFYFPVNDTRMREGVAAVNAEINSRDAGIP